MTDASPIAGRGSLRPPTLAEIAEGAFYVFALLLMSEALIAPVFAPDTVVEPPEWLRLIWLPVYAGQLVLLAIRFPGLRTVWIGGAATLVLVAFAFASEQWSVSPEITARRSLALLFTSLLGLQLAARYGWRTLLELFAATYLILAVSSAFTALAIPSLGVHADIHPGAWKGLWLEKNQLGAAMAKGALACLCAAMVARERRWLWTVGVVACSAMVVMSTSATSLIALLIVLAGAVALAGLRAGGPLAGATLAVGVVAVVCVVGVTLFAPELVLQALGKDATLTGRTDIWASLLRSSAVRPWEGYGYAAFWAEKLGPAYYVREEVQWNAPTAHNGWLDVLVQLGWIGVGLCAAHLALSAAAAGRVMLRGGAGVWAVLSTALFVLFSLSESTILQQNNINWAIYIATTAKLLQRRPSGRPAEEPSLVQAGRALARGDAAWSATRAASASLRRSSAAP